MTVATYSRPRRFETRGFLAMYRGVTLPGDLHPDRIVTPSVVGDGITDDTAALQTALTSASGALNKTVRIPADKNVRITDAIFMWGTCGFEAARNGWLKLDVPSANDMRLIHSGIQGILQSPPTVHTGRITGVRMEVTTGITGAANNAGRVIYFWRSRGVRVAYCHLETADWPYSLTTSGNNANYLAGANNYIRQNVFIDHNYISGTQDHLGGEGYGAGSIDGLIINDNVTRGVGDDAIGIHFCTDFQAFRNDLESVDGRIFISNSRRGRIAYNSHVRCIGGDGVWRTGVALIYIGFEQPGATPPAGTYAPEDILVDHNYVELPVGAVDADAMINCTGYRNVRIEDNTLKRDAVTGTSQGVHLWPMTLINWIDPTGIDSTTTARTHGGTVRRNTMIGANPGAMYQTGTGPDNPDPVYVEDNVGFSAYTPFSGNAVLNNNT